MSSWFDKLLEELQRRQAEDDAQREGRPFEPRERGEPRNVTPIDEGRRGRSGDGGDGGDGGNGGGDRPSRRSPAATCRGAATCSSAAGSSLLLVVLGLLGGAVNLITDVMWYDALGRRDVLQTRLWAQVGAVRHRLRGDAACPASSAPGWRAGSRRRRRCGGWAGSRCRMRRGAIGIGADRRRRPALARLGGGVERQLGDGAALLQRRRLGRRPIRRSAATSASTSSTCRSCASCSAGRRRR